MAKGRIVMTLTLDYEMNPNHYVGDATPLEMLETDIDSYTFDPYQFLELDNLDFHVDGYLLEDDNSEKVK